MRFATAAAPTAILAALFLTAAPALAQDAMQETPASPTTEAPASETPAPGADAPAAPSGEGSPRRHRGRRRSGGRRFDRRGFRFLVAGCEADGQAGRENEGVFHLGSPGLNVGDGRFRRRSRRYPAGITSMDSRGAVSMPPMTGAAMANSILT